MLQATTAARSGLKCIFKGLAQQELLAAPCLTGFSAPFRSSSGSSSSLSESSSNSPRPSTNDDRQDMDRYTHDHPPKDGQVPTAIEIEEMKRAAAGEDIFSSGGDPQDFVAAADAKGPGTESMTAPHTRHESASTKDFGGDPTRIEQPDPESLKEGHAIPNEGATTH